MLLLQALLISYYAIGFITSITAIAGCFSRFKRLQRLDLLEPPCDFER
jgi:hypothetical protein